MSLNIPASKPGIDQILYTLAARTGVNIKPAELPKNVRDLKLRENGGLVAEFAIDVDLTDGVRLEESIRNLRQFASVLAAAGVSLK